jgi:hypothetical protein
MDVDKGSLHVHLSRLLLGSLIARHREHDRRRRVRGARRAPGQRAVIGVPPPPPDIGGLVISVGFCVVAWWRCSSRSRATRCSAASCA